MTELNLMLKRSDVLGVLHLFDGILCQQDLVNTFH